MLCKKEDVFKSKQSLITAVSVFSFVSFVEFVFEEGFVVLCCVCWLVCFKRGLVSPLLVLVVLFDRAFISVFGEFKDQTYPNDVLWFRNGVTIGYPIHRTNNNK